MTNFDPSTLAANVVSVAVGIGVIARYGKNYLRSTIIEEVRPTLDAVSEHALASARGQKKLSKKVTAHARADEARFAEILTRLQRMETSP